jgi:hypothetical protein
MVSSFYSDGILDSLQPRRRFSNGGVECEVLHVFRASLYFLRLRTVTDAGARAVLQGCPRLRNTDIEYAINISHPLRLELIKR